MVLMQPMTDVKGLVQQAVNVYRCRGVENYVDEHADGGDVGEDGGDGGKKSDDTNQDDAWDDKDGDDVDENVDNDDCIG